MPGKACTILIDSPVVQGERVFLSIPICFLIKSLNSTSDIFFLALQAVYIRIKPEKKWSWGIDEPAFVEARFNVKRAKRD
jgi:hypothetical protein